MAAVGVIIERPSYKLHKDPLALSRTQFSLVTRMLTGHCASGGTFILWTPLQSPCAVSMGSTSPATI